MALTIEELAQRLEEEIAARELLERRLNTQSNNLVSVENSLSSQIQSVSQSLASYVQDAETRVQNEESYRVEEDQKLQQAIAANAKSIESEAEARTTSVDSLQKQIQANIESMSSLSSKVSGFQSSLDENANAIRQEYLERTNSLADLNTTVHDTDFELKQEIMKLQNSIDNLSAKADSVDDIIQTENAAREAMDATTSANAESIENITQRINEIDTELTQINKKFVDEDTVSGMISDNTVSQVQSVRDLLAEDRTAREADAANIRDIERQVQEYATSIQEANSQTQKMLDECKSVMQSSAVDVRETFNLLLPKGTILPYTGDIVNIPDGWRICNGANGTPDLVGKIFAGAHAVHEENEGFAMGDIGKVALPDNESSTEALTSNSLPYYCVYYIMKMF